MGESEPREDESPPGAGEFDELLELSGVDGVVVGVEPTSVTVEPVEPETIDDERLLPELSEPVPSGGVGIGNELSMPEVDEFDAKHVDGVAVTVTVEAAAPQPGGVGRLLSVQPGDDGLTLNLSLCE